MSSSTGLEQSQANAAAQSAPPPHVIAELRGPVLWLTLNRPEQRNPLSGAMIAALTAEILAANDNPGVRVLVISGSGPVFSAGHDLRELARREDETEVQHKVRVRQVLEDCARMMLAIVHSPKAIIACVQGTATAAGAQLVSACDLAIASERASFCTPGVNIGVFCTTPLVGLGRNMHRKHAMQMALTGDMLSAEDAVRFGLLNEAVPAEDLLSAVAALSATIASKSALAIRGGKEAFYRQIDMPLEQAFRAATEAMLQGLASGEAAEGARAFLEKRPPQWGDA